MTCSQFAWFRNSGHQELLDLSLMGCFSTATSTSVWNRSTMPTRASNGSLENRVCVENTAVLFPQPMVANIVHSVHRQLYGCQPGPKCCLQVALSKTSGCLASLDEGLDVFFISRRDRGRIHRVAARPRVHVLVHYTPNESRAR
jgi:hypothetical protein